MCWESCISLSFPLFWCSYWFGYFRFFFYFYWSHNSKRIIWRYSWYSFFLIVHGGLCRQFWFSAFHTHLERLTTYRICLKSGFVPLWCFTTTYLLESVHGHSRSAPSSFSKERTWLLLRRCSWWIFPPLYSANFHLDSLHRMKGCRPTYWKSWDTWTSTCRPRNHRSITLFIWSSRFAHWLSWSSRRLRLSPLAVLQPSFTTRSAFWMMIAARFPSKSNRSVVGVVRLLPPLFAHCFTRCGSTCILLLLFLSHTLRLAMIFIFDFRKGFL